MKLKNQVVSLELAKKLKEQLEIKTKEFEYVNQEKIELRAKLERYEKEEQAQDTMAMEYRRDLESQVVWMRELFELMVVDPEVIKAKTESTIKVREAEDRSYRIRMKEERKMMTMQPQPQGAKPKDYRF